MHLHLIFLHSISNFSWLFMLCSYSADHFNHSSLHRRVLAFDWVLFHSTPKNNSDDLNVSSQRKRNERRTHSVSVTHSFTEFIVVVIAKLMITSQFIVFYMYSQVQTHLTILFFFSVCHNANKCHCDDKFY